MAALTPMKNGARGLVGSGVMAWRKTLCLSAALPLGLAMASGGAARAQSLAGPGGYPAPVALTPDADRQDRVAKLVSQMTLDEKVGQMQNHAPAIPKLGIPAYDYWNEGLHGSARSGYSTMFPQAIGLAATWDTALLNKVADAISVEARAKHSEAVRHGNFNIYYGLTIWSPNINIFRDPRWGRGQETYGEDPFLTSRLGVAFVSGLQGQGTEYLRVVSTPKHFAVHSGPESTRHTANVDPTKYDLEDTYLPAFRATVTEGHAQSVMCAYNAIDGAPACANTHLQKDILRGAWGFHGFITSDCWAITDIAEGHKYAKDWEHASVDAVKAGTDTSCGTEFSSLTKAVKDGLIPESDLDVAVKRLFLARFRLGLFDPPSKVKYEQIPFSEVDSSAHRELALKTARESMVLLKNDGVLPLKQSVKTVAVIGPNAASLAALEGNYNAVPSKPVTPLDGLRTALAGRAKVLYAQGSSYVEPLSVPVPENVLQTDGKDGLKAEYFANAEFAGAPAMTRTDKQIDFDWNGASPSAGVPAKAFSVRWTGRIVPPSAGDYTFSLTLAHCYPCGDAEAYAVYLDGREIGSLKGEVKESRSAEGAPYKVHFDDTKPHELRVEYSHTAPLFGAGVTLEWIPPADALLAEAVKVAERADVVVAFVGLSPNLEGEEMPIKVDGFAGGDRTDVKLPEVQEAMLKAVAKTGKPMVVVLMNGSALAVNFAQEHAAAILEAWYPGEAGGTAIAETLLGGNNPGGRLPVTFYRSIEQLPAFDDYSMKARTYRYMSATPLYGFGDGLSYTQFAYSGAKLSSPTLAAGDPLTVSVKVANTGKMAGDEVVEVYLVPPASQVAPKKELVGFVRVHLAAGARKDVAVSVDPRQLSLVDAVGKRAIVAGDYKVFVGGHQPSGTESGLALTIVGSKALPE
jgi:beta-glucosidase